MDKPEHQSLVLIRHMRAAKSQMSLRMRADSSETKLLAYGQNVDIDEDSYLNLAPLGTCTSASAFIGGSSVYAISTKI